MVPPRYLNYIFLKGQREAGDYTHDQVAQIRTELKELLEIIDTKNADGMKAYLTKIRNNVKRDIEIKQ